jgi:hypothetical protein
MNKIHQLLKQMGMTFDEPLFHGTYSVENNGCELNLSVEEDEEGGQLFLVEYSDPEIGESIFSLTMNASGEFISAIYCDESISEEEFENEVEERFIDVILV